MSREVEMRSTWDALRAAEEARDVSATSPSWAKSFELALSVMFALLVANDIVISVEWIWQSLALSNAAGRAGIAVAVVAVIGSAVIVLVRGLTATLAYLTAFFMLGGQVVFAWSTTDPTSLPGSWWAWQLMVPVCVLIAAALPMSRRVPALVIAIGGYAALRLSPASGPTHGVTATLSDLSGLVLFSVLTSAIVPVWRRTARVSDEASRSRARSHAMTEAARAADRQRRAAARLLHDEVIHALRAISLPPGAIEWGVLQELARGASDLLGADSSTAIEARVASLSGALAELVLRSPLRIELRCPDELLLPGPVVAALTGAAIEALRNVERHSGVTEAVVEAFSLGDGVQIKVGDEGAGFAIGRLGTTSLGYTNSIAARVAEVGGDAHITSEIGKGTCVQITWSVPSRQHNQQGASHQLTDMAGTRVPLILGGVLPYAIFMSIQATLHWRSLDHPAAALIAAFTASAVTAAAAIWARMHQILAWQSIALAATAIAAAVVGGWNLKSADSVELAYFAAGAGGPALALLAFFRPRWESILGAAIVTMAAAAMVLRLDPHWATIGRALPAVLSDFIAVVAVLGARLTIDRMSRSIRWDEEVERQAETVRARLAVGRQVMAERLGRVQVWVLPFLGGVARGELDPADVSVRQQAVVLEAAVRDDIRLGASLSNQARELIALARRSGCRVEINAEPEVAALLPPGIVSELFMAALGGRDTPERVILTINGSPAETAAVSLLSVPATMSPELVALADRIGARVIDASTFVLLRAEVPQVTSPHVGTYDRPLEPIHSTM